LSRRAHPRAPRLAACLAVALLAGCGVRPWADETGRYAEPIGAAPVTDNATPYSDALACLSARLPEERPLIAVGAVGDYTGKYSDFTGNSVTQGAGLMAISAVAKLGLPMVERFDTALAERELKLANNNLIGDDGEVRKILPGSMPGSRYFLVGGVTELNFNIRSVAAEAFYSSGGLGGRIYVMNVGLDLRLVETETLRVVDVVSLQKQILGREVRAGVFEFFGDNLFDLSLEERALEPIQLAVRAMVEKAVGDLARKLFGLDPEACAPVTEGGAEPPPNLSNGEKT